MASEPDTLRLMVPARRRLGHIFGAGKVVASSSPTRYRGGGLLLDALLLGSMIGLAVTDQTVVFFHLAVLGVLIVALRRPLQSFVLRAGVVGWVASWELVSAVESGRAVAEELWEIPLMGALLAAAYGLKVQREQAQRRIDEARFRVIAGVAHDVRNPLTSAMGFSRLMSERGYANQPQEMVAMAGMIADATSEANEIIDDLLTASRLESGELTVAVTPVDLVLAANSLVDHYREEGDAILVRRPVGTGELVCLGDELRVRQILRNLLTNARRYGGSHIEIRIAADASAVRVQVVDDGAGIPERDRDWVFEPFTQSERVDRPVESVGVGLYTSRRLARLMGGDLTYRYEDGRSVFELRLPVVARGMPAVAADPDAATVATPASILLQRSTQGPQGP
ncbi:MAG: HAMP domain-containing sensor histidine kinase [Actinomycetota bacterium]